tara:strand:+ start:906 stop:1037 length:132 start_codon:yes stop_codon:yes gene_type:complete
MRTRTISQDEENMYPDEIIEEELENDEISTEEEAFWRGYNHAY